MPIAHRFTASPSLLRSNDTLYDITFGGRALTVSVFHQGTSAAFTVPCVNATHCCVVFGVTGCTFLALVLRTSLVRTALHSCTLRRQPCHQSACKVSRHGTTFTGRQREPKAQGSHAILSHAMYTWPRCPAATHRILQTSHGQDPLHLGRAPDVSPCLHRWVQRHLGPHAVPG